MSTPRPILRNAVFTAGLGTPVLLLHGSASSSSMWTPVINALKGSFRLIGPFALRHTSRSSMGVDFADIDRDGYDDVVVG